MIKTKSPNIFQLFNPAKITKKTLRDLKTKPAAYWGRLGEKMALDLFAFARKNVPAYRDFLKIHGVRTRHVGSLNAFTSLPIVDKKSYVKAYNMEDLLPHRDIGQATTVSSTSGSTGEPTYFPRGEEQDWQYGYIAELLLRNQFQIEKKKTLGIIGFGLGIWIGGIFTYKVFNAVAQKGYPLTLAPVGTNKKIFLKTFRDLAPHFDQIILMGYPPFVKDILDEGADEGIDWTKHRIKILTATEGFSERFREYLAKKAGLRNPLTDVVNIYGTVELGTMAHETPIANLVRRLAVRDRRVFDAVFPGATLLPTLTQYYPHLTYFEEAEGELLASGFGSSYPLVRYQLFDRGGVVPYETMMARLTSCGVDILAEAHRVKIAHTIIRLPFVYVYERSDFVIILRGANIYPEHVRGALQQEHLERFVTGKFTMVKREDERLAEYLEIHVERKKNVEKTAGLASAVAQEILDTLCAQNSEFNYLYTTEGTSIAPRVILHAYEDPAYFPPGIKQKWVLK